MKSAGSRIRDCSARRLGAHALSCGAGCMSHQVSNRPVRGRLPPRLNFGRTGGPNCSCLNLSLLPCETNIAQSIARLPAKKCRGSLKVIRPHLRRRLSHRRRTRTVEPRRGHRYNSLIMRVLPGASSAELRAPPGLAIIMDRV